MLEPEAKCSTCEHRTFITKIFEDKMMARQNKPLGILSSTIKNVTATTELDYETKELFTELKRTNTPYTVIDPESICVGIVAGKPQVWFASSDGSESAKDLCGLMVRRTRGSEEIILDFLEYCVASCPNLQIFDPLISFKRPTSKVAHLLPKLQLTMQPDTLVTRGYLPNSCSIAEPMIVKPSHGYKGEGVERVICMEDVRDKISALIQKNALGYGVLLQTQLSRISEFRILVVGGRALGVAEKLASSIDDVALNADKGHDFIEYSGVLKEDVRSLAEEAATRASLDFAGVDVIYDGEQLILLECNRNPQFAAFDHALHIRSARKIVGLMLERLNGAEDIAIDDKTLGNKKRCIPETHPRVFIGSSTEYLNIAESLQQGLSRCADVEIWNQGIFKASEVVFSKLTSVARDFDAAVFVISPDDFVSKLAEEIKQPRDNILFEIGLFMGVLGANKVWLVVSRSEKLSLPSDFQGLCLITWQMQRSGNLNASLGEACTEIKNLLATRCK
ncbi:MAG: nucleotide-binding protein [Gammaproteobacteria bacterium]|nr:nucleotide-binding protein [Gammaproteobacteria bacterium]MBU2343950.1 nucleotide-binding protein [Gammaproteobacteria bacterium]